MRTCATNSGQSRSATNLAVVRTSANVAAIGKIKINLLISAFFPVSYGLKPLREGDEESQEFTWDPDDA